MNFERNRDIKESLELGLSKDIPKWIGDNAEYNYTDYIDVWKWTLDRKWRKIERQKAIFDLIVNRRNKRWYNDIVDLSACNNELLWLSIDKNNEYAVRALLCVSGLFRKELLTLDMGTSILEGEFISRGGTEFPLRGTNLGTHIWMANQKGLHNLGELVKEYYENEI